jgi:hypothetical protein
MRMTRVFYFRKNLMQYLPNCTLLWGRKRDTVKQCTCNLKKCEILSTFRSSIVQYDNLVFYLNVPVRLYITDVFFSIMGCPIFIAVYCTVYIHTVGSQISIMQSWIFTYTLHSYIYMSNVSGVYYSKYHGYIFICTDRKQASLRK